MLIKNPKFEISVMNKSQYPKGRTPEIVLAGKSNVGKSSVINRVLNRKNFARVGASPGKTIHINYFLIDGKAFFVDLPGYGYAKVSMDEKKRWAKLIETYLNREEGFTLGIFIVDIRHKPTADDMVMADWFIQSGMPFYIVANKLDKLKKSQVEPAIQLIADTFNVPRGIIVPFSAEKGTGRDELVRIIQNSLE